MVKPTTKPERPGDIRLIVPADLMAKLRERADREHRDIRQQVLMYVERGLESERAA